MPENQQVLCQDTELLLQLTAAKQAFNVELEVAATAICDQFAIEAAEVAKKLNAADVRYGQELARHQGAVDARIAAVQQGLAALEQVVDSIESAATNGIPPADLAELVKAQATAAVLALLETTPQAITQLTQLLNIFEESTNGAGYLDLINRVTALEARVTTIESTMPTAQTIDCAVQKVIAGVFSDFAASLNAKFTVKIKGCRQPVLVAA